MAGMQSAESILEEMMPDVDYVLDKSVDAHADNKELQEQQLQAVLAELLKDKALKSLHSYIEHCTKKATELVEQLDFVYDLVPAATTKLTPAVREAALGKLYHTMVMKLPVMTAITGSPQVSSFVCLRLFKLISSRSAMPPKEPPSLSHSQEELDVITYIAGSVVAKIMKARRNYQRQDYAIFKEVIALLTTEEECENSTMVDILDRGGLTRVKPQVSHMFVSMEDTFLTLFNQNTRLSRDAYIKACGEQDDILCGFFETVYDSDATDEIKEDVINQIITLYFTIRVHQRCRVYMDQVRYHLQQDKKEKAIRKKLNSYNSDL